MTDWRLAKCLMTLRNEVNARFPHRKTASDGTIGDTAHQAQGSASDHNPNSHGVVTAWDITADTFSNDLANFLNTLGKNGDQRVKYIIWNRRISSQINNWAWRTYTGSDPHTSHIHLSCSADPAQYDRTDQWGFNKVIPPYPSQFKAPSYLHRGMTDPVVAKIKSRFHLAMDNHFDDGLNAVIREFQKERHLAIDGIVGPNTWREIWR